MLGTLRCTVCDSSSTSPDPFFYEWRGGNWRIQHCRQCSHQFVWPTLSATDQEAIYTDHYFSQEGDWVEGYWQKGYLEAERELRAEARQVLRMIPRDRGRLLEIGCAGGFFLDEARVKFDVSGIELNQTMADHASRMGIPVLRGRVEDVTPEGPFDVLVLMDVLEHIPDPRALFRQVQGWLSSDACILIRGPLHNDPVAKAKEWLRRALRLKKRLPGYPLDTNLFTRQSLERLLSDVGYRHITWLGLTKSFSNLVATRDLTAHAVAHREPARSESNFLIESNPTLT